MWGEVFLAAETGEASPPCVAFDADGNPTVDGRAAATGGVAAFGGHKGYGPAFEIQALRILAGAAPARPGAGLRVSVSGCRSRHASAREHVCSADVATGEGDQGDPRRPG